MGLSGRLNDHLVLFSSNHVHELLLFYSCHHGRPSTGIYGDMLTRNYTPASAFAESLVMGLNKPMLMWTILQDDDFTRVGAYDEAIPVSLC